MIKHLILQVIHEKPIKVSLLHDHSYCNLLTCFDCYIFMSLLATKCWCLGWLYVLKCCNCSLLMAMVAPLCCNVCMNCNRTLCISVMDLELDWNVLLCFPKSFSKSNCFLNLSSTNQNQMFSKLNPKAFSYLKSLVVTRSLCLFDH